MKSILITFLITIFLQNSIAQSLDDNKLFELYKAQNFEELKSELAKFGNNKKPEIEFLKTVFMENGEEALKVYLKIFENSFGNLKSIVSKKLSDYYYAKGYYLTASKYQKYLVESTSTKSQNNNTIQTNHKKYIIQLGAFGLKENAVK